VIRSVLKASGVTSWTPRSEASREKVFLATPYTTTNRFSRWRSYTFERLTFSFRTRFACFVVRRVTFDVHRVPGRPVVTFVVSRRILCPTKINRAIVSVWTPVSDYEPTTRSAKRVRTRWAARRSRRLHRVRGRKREDEIGSPELITASVENHDIPWVPPPFLSYLPAITNYIRTFYWVFFTA